MLNAGWCLQALGTGIGPELIKDRGILIPKRNPKEQEGQLPGGGPRKEPHGQCGRKGLGACEAVPRVSKANPRRDLY